jgi:N,N'-diacetylchitobiose transport system permease protein
VLGTLIALLLTRLSRWVRIPLLTSLVLVWSMPVVVAVPGLLLDDELRERRHHLHPPSGAPRAGEPRLVRLVTSSLAMVTLLIVWGALPFIVVTVYARCAQVPGELVEAARVDGAGALGSSATSPSRC